MAEQDRQDNKLRFARDLKRTRQQIKDGSIDSEEDYAKVWGKSTNAEARAHFDRTLGKDRPALPICPYGCGSEGTFLESMMLADGRCLGIYTDYPFCSDGCIFVAEIQQQEPPKQRKQELRLVNGEYQYVEVEG